MYTDVAQWQKLLHRMLKEGVSQRQIMRETGMHRVTVHKILMNPMPVAYKKRASAKRHKHREHPSVNYVHDASVNAII